MASTARPPTAASSSSSYSGVAHRGARRAEDRGFRCEVARRLGVQLERVTDARPINAKSARSSTAVLVWTTVQLKKSSGPAALAVHRYGAEPSSHLPEAPDTSQLECSSHGSGDEGDGHLVAAYLLQPAVAHGRVHRGVALAVSPPAPPSKRPCPTARRRGCSWSGAVTTSPWLLESDRPSASLRSALLRTGYVEFHISTGCMSRGRLC